MRLDSLIANAGIGMFGGILDHTDEALPTMLDTTSDDLEHGPGQLI